MDSARVYLGGGMRSGWQDRLKRSCVGEHFIFLDPRRCVTREPREYQVVDLYNIRRCDILFAYLEASNPGGAALVGECGYAKGLGKTVIVVNEKDDKYMKFIEAFADIVFTNFDEAVEFLKRF